MEGEKEDAMLGSVIRQYRMWQEGRKRLRIEKLTARAAKLNDGTSYDLFFLQDSGFVRARATGQSITRIDGEIENLVGRTIRAVIDPGTYFVARGNYQNMVTREKYTLKLHPTSTHKVSINAACI